MKIGGEETPDTGANPSDTNGASNGNGLNGLHNAKTHREDPFTV
jgi:hypothetical protein